MIPGETERDQKQKKTRNRRSEKRRSDKPIKNLERWEVKQDNKPSGAETETDKNGIKSETLRRAEKDYFEKSLRKRKTKIL